MANTSTAPVPGRVIIPVAAGAAGALAMTVRSGADAVKAVLSRFALVGISSPFQSADWVSTWIDTLGTPRNCEMLVVDVCDGVSGAPLMALPLVRRRARNLTLIELPDFGMADYGGPMIAPGFAPDQATMRRLWSSIISALPKADLLRLDKLPAKIGGLDNPLMKLKGVRRHAQSAWGTRLTEPPLDFSALGMTKKRIRELNGRHARLEAMGTFAFRTAGTEEEADRFFEAMCVQRAKRFGDLGRPNALQHADIRKFFRALIRPGDAGSPAVMQALTLDDQVLATGYALRGRDSYCMIFPTFDHDNWRIYSPGLQLFRHAMEWAARNKLYYFDFTIGSEAYKTEFGATEMDLFEMIQPLSLRGIAASAALTARWHIRRQPRLARFLRQAGKHLIERSR